MSLFVFPNHYIWTGRVQEHEEIKRLMMPHIDADDKKKSSWNCDVTSSYGENKTFFHNEYFLNQVVWNPLDLMLMDLQDTIQMPKESNIQEMWYNSYVPGQYQEVHNHRPKGVFSGIYLLHLEGKNTTAFVNHHDHPLFNNTKVMDDVQEGDVILFPSTLLHYVNPSPANKVTISYNIGCIF